MLRMHPLHGLVVRLVRLRIGVRRVRQDLRRLLVVRTRLMLWLLEGTWWLMLLLLLRARRPLRRLMIARGGHLHASERMSRMAPASVDTQGMLLSARTLWKAMSAVPSASLRRLRSSS